MRAVAVARHEIEVAQQHRWLRALFVEPAHGAPADHELGLVEEPVGHRDAAAARAREVDAGHLDAAIDQAAHVQHRLIDVNLLEATTPQ